MFGETQPTDKVIISEELIDVTSIDAGGYHLALKADGSVIAWGRNNYGQGEIPEGLGSESCYCWYSTQYRDQK